MSDTNEAGKPEPTPDCCEVWPKIAGLFGWFRFGDCPDLLAMSYMVDEDGEKWRVNYCPSCGAERRSCIMQAQEEQL